MLNLVRRAMRTPMARPPGKRGLGGGGGGGDGGRFGPEWFALAVWCVFFGVLAGYLCFSSPAGGGRLASGMVGAAGVAYGAGSLFLLLAAIRAGALAWAGERDGNAMEALLLTPMDHYELGLGRFWHVLVPCLKALAYMFPLYAIMAAGALPRHSSPEIPMMLAFAPKLGCSYLVACIGFWQEPTAPSMQGFALMAVRLLDDLSVVLFATAAAYYVATRVAGTSRALWISHLLVLGAMVTVMVPELWLTAFVGAVGGGPVAVYVAPASAAILIRYLLALWLVPLAARRFTSCALGKPFEQTDPSPAPPAVRVHTVE